MVTRKELVEKVRNLANRGIGVDADGAFGTQCADLPNYYSIHDFGKRLSGNAIDFLNSAEELGFYVKYNAPDDINPKAGDVFVMDTRAIYGHAYGHTGIVIEDSDGYTIKTVEQNIDGNKDSLEVGAPARYNTRSFNGIVGWFSFPFDEDTVEEATGWIEDDNGWTYCDEDGIPVNKWKEINGAWYKFDLEGYILTNEWIAQEDKWYWLKDDGAMAKGWHKIDNKWYFFNADGSMHEGWLEYYDKWYYLNPSDGDMVSRECRNIDGEWYYFNEDGDRLEKAEITVDSEGRIHF